MIFINKSTAKHCFKTYNTKQQNLPGCTLVNQSACPYYQNRIGDYAVPVIYYHSGNPDLKYKDMRLTQNIDRAN